MSSLIESRSGLNFQSRNVGLPIADYCKALLVRLSDHPSELQTLGLTSCARGEGVTTVAAQLAATAATMTGQRVVLVDGNLLNPGVHRLFDVSLGPGLREALRQTAVVGEVVQASSVPNLSLLTAGEQHEDSDSEFTWARLKHVLADLHQEFGLVILDLPTVAEGLPAGLGALSDGLILIVEAEKVRWQIAQRTASHLTLTGVNVLGVVMNKRPDHIPRWLYKTL